MDAFDMMVVGYGVALGLATVLGWSVAAHLAEPGRIVKAVGDLGLPGRLGLAAAASEAGLIAPLILSPRLGGVLCASYLVLLMVVFAGAVLAGRDIEDCACGRTSHRVSATWFARDAALALAALTVALIGPAGFVQAASVGGAILAVVIWFYLNERTTRSLAHLPNRVSSTEDEDGVS